MSWLETWFENPWVLVLLGLLPGLAMAGLLMARRRRRATAELTGVRAAVSLPSGGGRLRFLARSLALALVVLGSAGPRWGRDSNSPAPLGRDLFVVLDISRSMLAEDRAGEARLTRAKRALLDLVAEIERRGGTRLGLIAFAGQARILCPLTDDYDHFRFALDLAHPDYFGPAERIGYRGDGTGVGTALAPALELALRTHERSAAGFQEVLLVSDGDDQGGDWQAAVDQARSAGIPLHVLGVGDPERNAPIPTGRPNEPFLEFEPGGGQPRQRVATRRHDEILRPLATGAAGVYVPEESRAQPLAAWYREHLAPLPVRERTDDGRPVLTGRSGWFFGGALLLLVFELLSGLPRRVSPEAALEISSA